MERLRFSLMTGLLLLGLSSTYTQITLTANHEIVGLYDIFELTIQHPHSYSNNWEDVKVKVTFLEGTRPIQIDGFYYGTNTWKVRFAPPALGYYNFQLSFITPSDTFNQEGSFTCVTSSTKGFLQRHPTNPFRLIFPDGTLFNGIGIGDCINDLDSDGTPHNNWGFDGDFRPSGQEEGWETSLTTYVSAYGKSGFNLFRWSIDNCAFNLYDHISTHGNEYLIREGIWGDSLVQELRQNGIRIWTTLFGFNPPFPELNPLNSEERKAIQRYVRYVVARYGAYTDIWELYNEATTSDNWIHEIASFINSIDPYDRLISVSWQKPWLDPITIDSPHWYEKESELDSDLRAWDKITGEKIYNKPIIFGEQGNSEQNWDSLSALRMRIRSWTAFFAEGIFIFWNSSFAKDYYGNVASNIYLGPEERNYIKILQEFSGLADSSIRQLAMIPFNSQEVRAYGLTSPNMIMSYFHHYKSHSTEVSSTFDLVLPRPGTINWINPADNTTIRSEVVQGGSQIITSPPFSIDLAMWINMDATTRDDFWNAESNILVYPNPSKGSLSVKGHFRFPVLIQIYGLGGENLYTKSIFSQDDEINLHGLSPGLYIYKVNTINQKYAFGRFIIE